MGFLSEFFKFLTINYSFLNSARRQILLLANNAMDLVGIELTFFFQEGFNYCQSESEAASVLFNYFFCSSPVLTHFYHSFNNFRVLKSQLTETVNFNRTFFKQYPSSYWPSGGVWFNTDF